MKGVCLYGIRPSGSIHYGNIIALTSQSINTLLVADINALSSAEEIYETYISVKTIRDILYPTQPLILYVQSSFSKKLFEIFQNIATKITPNFLLKNPTISLGDSLNNFYYAALMCADIILIDPKAVYIGKDNNINGIAINKILHKMNYQSVKFITTPTLKSFRGKDKMSKSKPSGCITPYMNEDEIKNIINKAKTSTELFNYQLHKDNPLIYCLEKLFNTIPENNTTWATIKLLFVDKASTFNKGFIEKYHQNKKEIPLNEFQKKYIK